MKPRDKNLNEYIEWQIPKIFFSKNFDQNTVVTWAFPKRLRKQATKVVFAVISGALLPIVGYIIIK